MNRFLKIWVIKGKVCIETDKLGQTSSRGHIIYSNLSHYLIPLSFSSDLPDDFHNKLVHKTEFNRGECAFFKWFNLSSGWLS